MTRLMMLLNKLFASPNQYLNSQNLLLNYSQLLLEEIILNNLVWRPGRKAISLRGLTADLLLKALQLPPSEGNKVLGVLKTDVLQGLLEKTVIPNLNLTLEEDVIPTRMTTISIYEILLSSSLQFEGKLVGFLSISESNTSENSDAFQIDVPRVFEKAG
jgi:hypothetical protein